MKPRLRFYTGKPYTVDNGQAKTTRFQIFCNCRWLVVYYYTQGKYQGTYVFKNGKDKTVRFKTINELNERQS
jgi:hypothetical protein